MKRQVKSLVVDTDRETVREVTAAVQDVRAALGIIDDLQETDPGRNRFAKRTREVAHARARSRERAEMIHAGVETARDPSRC